MTTIEFGCCFCGESGAECGLVLTDMEGDFGQQWWCHLRCLLEAMNEHARSAYQEVSE